MLEEEEGGMDGERFIHKYKVKVKEARMLVFSYVVC